MPVSLTWKRMGSAWTQPKTPRGNLIASSPKRQATSPKRKRTSKKTHPITTNHWRDRWSDNQHPGPRRSFTVVLIPTKIWFYQVNVLQNRDKHRQNIKQLISLPETNSFASENRPSIKLCIPTIHFQVSGGCIYLIGSYLLCLDFDSFFTSCLSQFSAEFVGVC